MNGMMMMMILYPRVEDAIVMTNDSKMQADEISNTYCVAVCTGRRELFRLRSKFLFHIDDLLSY